MRGLFYNLAPFTPDTVAASSFFTDTAALVIPIDMNGTVSTFRGRVGIDPESKACVCSILGSRESSYVMGADADFSRECLELMEDFGHDYTVLVHGPVSSMVGLDLYPLAEELEEQEGKPVIAIECSGSGSYEAGLTSAAKVVFKRVRSLPAEPRPGTYNILGINAVDHNNFAFRDLLVQQIRSAMGTPELSIWGCRDDWEAWEQARFASENIVASASAVPLAKLMKRTWGIPWRPLTDLALFANVELTKAEKGLRILVVSEHLMASMARDLLEAAGHNVTVGTFFSSVANVARPSDLFFESEMSFIRTMREGSFDLIIGDEALRDCLPEGQSFFNLPHSAVARYGDPFEGPVPFSAQWLHELDEALQALAE